MCVCVCEYSIVTLVCVFMTMLFHNARKHLLNKKNIYIVYIVIIITCLFQAVDP